VTADDAKESLDKVAAIYGADAGGGGEGDRAGAGGRAGGLFAANLPKAFYAFEPDFFQQNLLRIVDDVVTVIRGRSSCGPRSSRSATSRRAARGYRRSRSTTSGGA